MFFEGDWSEGFGYIKYILLLGYIGSFYSSRVNIIIVVWRLVEILLMNKNLK